MNRLVAAVVFALLALAVVAPPVYADGADCGAVAGLNQVAATCQSEGATLTEAISSAPSGTVYKTAIQCLADPTGGCLIPRTCTDPPGAVRYDVLRSTDGGVTFEKVSEACLNRAVDEGEEAAPPVLTPGDVATAFRAISWPPSPLEVQPAGGRTLVNLETNFFTTNTASTSQTVPLLDQQVEIEATPSSWTWVHGDGTSQTTTDPGAAYPALDVTHTYTDADATRAPRVDTTYSGRYRVNGGPWVQIPATVTVTGTAGQLEVVPATPQLVGAG